MRAEPKNRRPGPWRRGAAIALIVVGVLAGALTVALFRFTNPPFPYESCGNRFNTDGYFGSPKGTRDGTLQSHYTLIPFQMVCSWDRNDGNGVETTYIELGTWVPVTSLVGLAGGIALLLTTTRGAKVNRPGFDGGLDSPRGSSHASTEEVSAGAS